MMQAVAHDPTFAKKVGIPTSVGKDFAAADKAAGPGQRQSGRRFTSGKGMVPPPKRKGK